MCRTSIVAERPGESDNEGPAGPLEIGACRAPGSDEVNGEEPAPKSVAAPASADAQQRVPTAGFFQRFRMQREVLALVVKCLLVTNTDAIGSVITGLSNPTTGASQWLGASDCGDTDRVSGWRVK